MEAGELEANLSRAAALSNEESRGQGPQILSTPGEAPGLQFQRCQ
jgi:hypothetical protein